MACLKYGHYCAICTLRFVGWVAQCISSVSMSGQKVSLYLSSNKPWSTFINR